MKLIIYILICFLFVSCQTNAPSWVLEKHHSLSPDENAAIYQSSYFEDDSFNISLATWVSSSFSSGGSGVFDLKSKEDIKLSFDWVSDSIVVISYPKKTTRVLRKRSKTFFSGRTSHFQYNPLN